MFFVFGGSPPVAISARGSGLGPRCAAVQHEPMTSGYYEALKPLAQVVIDMFRPSLAENPAAPAAEEDSEKNNVARIGFVDDRGASELPTRVDDSVGSELPSKTPMPKQDAYGNWFPRILQEMDGQRQFRVATRATVDAESSAIGSAMEA